MLKCVHNQITLTRGDSAILEVSITDETGTPYVLGPDDVILFTLKRATSTRDVLFQKRLIDGAIRLSPQDTSRLEYGQYYYDVELTKADGFVATVIPPSLFTVAEEVTW